MFALAGIAAALALMWLSPGEWWAPLRYAMWPALFLGFFGYVIDLRLRRVRPEMTPQLPWALVAAALLAWQGALPLPAFLLYLLVAHSIQSLRALRAITGLILLLTVFVSIVAVEQGLAPQGCFRRDETALVWDGRRCQSRADCEREAGAEAGADYRCEHVGLFDTQSLRGRARFQGGLADPDVFGFVIALGVPFALTRRRIWLAPLAVAALIFAWTAPAGPSWKLWMLLPALYLSLKIPLAVLRRTRGRPEAEPARQLARSLLISSAALAAGIWLVPAALPFAWVFVGLSGALYSCVRTHDPDFRVTGDTMAKEA